jgi:three-Cys-motif partner protein
MLGGVLSGKKRRVAGVGTKTAGRTHETSRGIVAMPARPRETVWAAEPHTIAKIKLLSAYLKAWFSILGTRPVRQGRDLLYVDGFAGPGEYRNYPDGSPTIAVQAAVSCLGTHTDNWKAGDIHCAFIELDEARLNHLEQRMKSVQTHPRVHLHFYTGTFASQLRRVRADIPIGFQDDSPLFVFIDPFGATGVPFATVSDVLASWCSEVLSNFDADGIARNLCNDHVLDEIFGDGSWHPVRNEHLSFEMQCRRLLSLYKEKLKGQPSVKHVFSFEMRGSDESLNYNLVFATGHPRGLEKMKQAMKTIDQSGEYSFTDADVGQPRLFRFDNPVEFARKMHETFAGKRLRPHQWDSWALDETPFVNAKKMLTFLEKNGRIEVEPTPGSSRKPGTFPEGKVRSIRFRALNEDA